MTPDKLPCPHCHSQWPLNRIFDYSNVSWPTHHWIQFHCPACLKPSHVKLTASEVSIGHLEGGSFPSFVPSHSIHVDGLGCAPGVAGLTIQYAGNEWLIPAQK